MTTTASAETVSGVDGPHAPTHHEPSSEPWSAAEPPITGTSRPSSSAMPARTASSAPGVADKKTASGSPSDFGVSASAWRTARRAASLAVSGDDAPSAIPTDVLPEPSESPKMPNGFVPVAPKAPLRSSGRGSKLAC